MNHASASSRAYKTFVLDTYEDAKYDVLGWLIVHDHRLSADTCESTPPREPRPGEEPDEPSQRVHCCPTSDQRHEIPRCRPYELQGVEEPSGTDTVDAFLQSRHDRSVVPYRCPNGNMVLRRDQTRWRRCSRRHGTGHDVAMITRTCISVQFLRHKLVGAGLLFWINSNTSIIRRCQTEK